MKNGATDHHRYAQCGRGLQSLPSGQQKQLRELIGGRSCRHWCAAVQVAEQLCDVVLIGLDVLGGLPQCLAHRFGEAQGPAQTKIHSAGVERLKHQELFGDHHGLVVGEHHSAGPEPNA